MGLETSCCFQVISTITSSSAAAAAPAARNCIRRTLQPLNRDHKQLINPPAGAPRFAIDCRRGRVICRAKNTVDEAVVVVVEKNWENLVMGSEKPVLVEFWAPWCGPCRMIAPLIKDLAKDYAGKIVCCSVNTDDCPGIASRLGIRSIPTVLVFKKGEKKESVIGAVPKSTLVGVVDKYLEL